MAILDPFFALVFDLFELFWVENHAKRWRLVGQELPSRLLQDALDMAEESLDRICEVREVKDYERLKL